uniref:C2H2-type domain-containing protein n=1 Tax=Timema cristinae TaxID=61476 RepID=A0A7R9GUJ3_TIMCR|nr:unnamed protein product [Timema cristinae]
MVQMSDNNSKTSKYIATKWIAMSTDRRIGGREEGTEQGLCWWQLCTPNIFQFVFFDRGFLPEPAVERRLRLVYGTVCWREEVSAYDRQSSSSTGQRNHHNLHTGRRPYTCTFCPRTFANGSNCRSHKRRMHPDELRVYEANLASAANGDVQLPLHNGEESLNINSSANLSTSTEKLEQLSSVHLNMNSNMSQHSTMLPLSKTTSSLNSEFGNRSIQDVNMFMNPLSMKVNLDSPPLSRSSLNPADLTPTTTPTAYQRSSDSQEMSHASISHLSSSETLNRNSSLTSHMISNSSTSLVQDTEGNHLRSSQPPSRNGHMSPDDSISCNIPLASSHSTINLNSRRNMNSVTSAESLIHSSGHLQSLTPLNLNISEIHTNRQHSLSIMDESELLSRRRVLENFQTSNASVPRHHIPSLNTNLHSLHRQHQQHHHSLSSINRDAERELMELNRSSTQREMLMTNSNVNVMHHSQHSTSNSEQVGVLHDFSTSLNHLYHQHQTPTMTSAVAAAIAHSSTVGVPAFPGNPYVHHNMNYSRGNGAM